MSELFDRIFSKSLLTEPSTDLFLLLTNRAIFVISVLILIVILIERIAVWKTDKSHIKSDIVGYLLLSLFTAYLVFDCAKAFTVSSKPSPTLLQISDKISVEGDRVTIEPIKDEYPTYRYKGRLKETNVIRLTLKENDMNPEEESKLIDWKSDEYSLSKEEYEMLKSKRRS